MKLLQYIVNTKINIPMHLFLICNIPATLLYSLKGIYTGTLWCWIGKLNWAAKGVLDILIFDYRWILQYTTKTARVRWHGLPDGPMIAINSLGLKYAEIPFRILFLLPNAYSTI